MTTLPTLGQGDQLIENGGPTVRFQALWLEAMAALEQAGGDIEAVEAALADKQNAAAILSALAALASNGLIARTGADTVAARTITGPAAGLSVTNGSGVAGNPTIALVNDLAALEGLSGTGLAKRTGADTWGTIFHDEGTFTPSLAFGGGSTGIAYVDQFGRYARIGNRAFFEIRIGLSSKGSSTGVATITNLPFMAAGTGSTSGGFRSGNMTATVNATYWRVYPGQSTIALDNFAAGAASNLTDASFTNSSLITLEGFYTVA